MTKTPIIKGLEDKQILLELQKHLKEYSTLLRKSDFKAFELEIMARNLPYLKLNKALKQDIRILEELEIKAFETLSHLEIRIQNAKLC